MAQTNKPSALPAAESHVHLYAAGLPAYITLIHAHAHTSDTPPHTAICHTRTHAAGRLLLSSAALVAPHALGASSPFICSSMRNMATFQVPRRAKLGIKPL